MHLIRSQPASSLRECDPLEVIESLLQRRLNGRVKEFKILPFENGLVLKGRVRTYYEKQLAQHVVMEATTQPILSNEIEVRFGG